MPLSDKEIKQALENGVISISPLKDHAIQPASVDLTLGPKVKVIQGDDVIDITQDITPRFVEVDLSQDEYIIPPGGFVLGAANETVSMGPYCGLVLPRSSFARMGILCPVSMYMNPGYEGTPPIAIINLSGKPVRLAPGVRMVQIIFLEVGEIEKMYGSRPDRKYLGEKGPTPPRQHLDEEIKNIVMSFGFTGSLAQRAQNLLWEQIEKAASENVKRYYGR